MTEETPIKSATKMADELKYKLEKLPSFAKRYSEFRARFENGKQMSQSEASRRAGSEGSTKAILGRVGYNTEQLDGVSEYILWLQQRDASSSIIDSTEVAEKFRRIYDDAVANGNLSAANKAAEMLGHMIGAFNKDNPKKTELLNQLNSNSTKNNTSAFKEESEGVEKDDKLAAMIKLIEDTKD